MGDRMKRFIEGEDRKQVTLLPECLDDFVAEDNPVRIIEALLKSLTLHQWASMARCRLLVVRPIIRACC